MKNWTSGRQNIYLWIKRDLGLPVYADVYRGAVIALYKKQSGYITFVSHACRDIMNGLAPTYNGQDRVQVQYVQLVNTINLEWKSEWGNKGIQPSGSGPIEAPAQRTLPFSVCEKIQKLLDEHQSGRLRSGEIDTLFFRTFLDYKDKNSVPKDLVESWSQARSWFMDRTHLRKNTYSKGDIKQVTKHFKDFEQTLLAAAESVTSRLKNINEILEKTN